MAVYAHFIPTLLDSCDVILLCTAPQISNKNQDGDVLPRDVLHAIAGTVHATGKTAEQIKLFSFKLTLNMQPKSYCVITEFT